MLDLLSPKVGLCDHQNMEQTRDTAEAPLSVHDQRHSQLDLIACPKPDQLQKISDLRATVGLILGSLGSYSTALDEGNGIARRLSVPLLGSRVEDIIGGSFSSPCPRIVEMEGSGEWPRSYSELGGSHSEGAPWPVRTAWE